MELKNNLSSLYGQAGEQWLAELPLLLKRLEDTLKLRLEPPYSNLTFHYVAKATARHGKSCVLKCGVPHPELQNEMAALQAYAGKGCIELLNADPQEGWLLLEACEPGTPLSQEPDDEKATHALIEVMRTLWKPAPPGNCFTPIQHGLKDLEKIRLHPHANRLFSSALLDFVCESAEGLQTSLGEPVLLHADLHHDNVLKSQRSPYLAIDPKGWIGEREYEVGALIRNPLSRLQTERNLPRFLTRRLDQIAEETGFDRQRVALWSLIQTVLALYWQIEDGGQPEPAWVRCAEILADPKPRTCSSSR